ncbi:hypothetical protein D3C83_100190 [compost metagenome]
MDGAAFGCVGVRRRRDRDVAGEQAFGAPAGIAVREPLEAAHEKRGGGEQHERERKLGDDERLSQAMLRGHAGGSP